MSEFWRLVVEEFGEAHGRALVADHVVGALGQRTAGQALAAGEEPRTVWFALCEEMAVPEQRRWGKEFEKKGRGVSRTSNTRSD
jgi:hypothetical protein